MLDSGLSHGLRLLLGGQRKKTRPSASRHGIGPLPEQAEDEAAPFTPRKTEAATRILTCEAPFFELHPK